MGREDVVRVICKAARGDGRTGGRGVREAVAGPCPPFPIRGRSSLPAG